MILIVAPEDDLHACVVVERLRARARQVEILNTTWFPWRLRLSWSVGPARIWGASEINFSEVSVVWWRRFRRPTPDPCITDSHVRQFCVSESLHSLRGIFSSLAVPVINDPNYERRASLKLLQLTTARRLGLSIPDTIVSNDREEILGFLQSHKAVICKTIVCDYPHSIPTRECRADDFASILSTSLSPIIVQETVLAVRDIRITVVGDKVFAGELRRPDINAAVDWRMTATGWEPHELPPSIGQKVVAYVRELKLSMASLDLRLTEEGDYVFLEVNPSGQFLFLEIDANLPISAAVADLLISHADSGRR